MAITNVTEESATVWSWRAYLNYTVDSILSIIKHKVEATASDATNMEQTPGYLGGDNIFFLLT